MPSVKCVLQERTTYRQGVHALWIRSIAASSRSTDAQNVQVRAVLQRVRASLRWDLCWWSWWQEEKEVGRRSLHVPRAPMMTSRVA